MRSRASIVFETGLDRTVSFHLEQRNAGATVLLFRPRFPAMQNVSDCRLERDAPPAELGLRSVPSPNRPAAVVREILWAVAIPIGIVLALRALFALLHAL